MLHFPCTKFFVILVKNADISIFFLVINVLMILLTTKLEGKEEGVLEG